LTETLTIVNDNTMSCGNSRSSKCNPCGPSQDAMNEIANKAAYYARIAQYASDGFSQVYLGAKDVAPTTDNDGNPLIVGALYFNTVSTILFVWDGTNWISIYDDEIYLGGFSVAPTLNNQGLPLQTGNLYWNTGSNNLWAYNGTAWIRTNFNETTPFLSTGSTAARTLANRFADVVNVKDFGAVGDGITDDTVAIQSAIALASGKSIYFPNGIYVFNGVISSLFDIPLFGGGTIRINGYDYPVQREQALNQLWAGEARCWPMGNALECSAVQRTHIPAGASISRTVFADEVTLYHVNGDYSEDAIRIQRNATTSNTSSAVLVFSLTQDESQTLVGKNVVLQWNGSKSSTYTGGNVTYKIQWSEEPQQPIINADGTYSNGNQTAISGAVALGTTARNNNTPYWTTTTIPSDAIQVSVVFVIPFSGTAGTDDYIDLESVSLFEGTKPANVLVEAAKSILAKGATRYQTSYPSSFPRGTLTRQGSVQAVAINANINYAFAIPVRFSPTMAIPPQFFFQNTISGTENRLLNVTTNLSLNGLSYYISENGVTITNNGAVSANDQVLCQWTANILL